MDLSRSGPPGHVEAPSKKRRDRDQKKPDENHDNADQEACQAQTETKILNTKSSMGDQSSGSVDQSSGSISKPKNDDTHASAEHETDKSKPRSMLTPPLSASSTGGNLSNSSGAPDALLNNRFPVDPELQDNPNSGHELHQPEQGPAQAASIEPASIFEGRPVGYGLYLLLNQPTSAQMYCPIRRIPLLHIPPSQFSDMCQDYAMGRNPFRNKRYMRNDDDEDSEQDEEDDETEDDDETEEELEAEEEHPPKRVKPKSD